MAWTEERVERLSRLWLEGRTASQIATELGEGVTRNAVIGKAHRLRLSGRVVPPAPERPVPAPRAEHQPPAPILARASLLDADDEMDDDTVVPSFDVPVLVPAPEVMIPLSDRVTILELGAAMCRWPLGDPTSVEFRYCGCRALGSLPYCQDHARKAFQPVADRRRVERVARIA